MATTINPSDQTITQYTVQVGGASNLLASVGPGSSGQVLQSAGNAANPAYSTATFPATATGTGTILRADGTNWSATTSTYPNTNAVSTLLYASSANVMAALATGNSKVLTTDSSGVPSLSNAFLQSTWTPALNFGGSTTGITYTTQVGNYMQIGNLVFLTFVIQLSSKGAQTGAATLTGLPIACKSGAGNGVVFPLINEGAITLDAGFTVMAGTIAAAASTIVLNEQSVSVFQAISNTNFSNTSAFGGIIHYFSA